MLRKLPTVLLLLAIAVPCAWAQTGTVRGEVTDTQNGEPLPGVSVVVEGANTGAATGGDGSYEIQDVPVGEQVLRATFVGFSDQEKTIEVRAGEVTEVNFQMGADPLGMDEVVVTGTGGAVEKRKLGNTISTIDAGGLEDSPVARVGELLQGREPGVTGLPGGGMTGQGTEIRIRGSSSLSRSNEPVVYVDGIRYNSSAGFGGLVNDGADGGNTSRLDDINPESIERVEILKGAAAATLYGSEASNGVVQIFTKRGDANLDAPRYSFSTTQGFTQFPEGRVRDQVGYASFDQQIDNMEQVMGGDFSKYELVRQNAVTDMFETGRVQTYSGSLEGGNDIVTYYASGRFSTENGPLGSPTRGSISARPSDAATRSQANVNLGITPTESTQISVTTAYNQLSFQTYTNSNNIYAPVTMAFSSNPKDVTPGEDGLEYGQNTFASVEEALQQALDQEVERFTGTANINYRPLEMLTLDGTFGADFSSSFGTETRPFGWDLDGLTGFVTEGQRLTSNVRNLELTLNTRAILENEFESIESTFTAGVQGFVTRRRTTSEGGSSFPGPGFNVTDAASQIDPFEQFREIVQLGLFGQEQIGLNNFAYLTLGGRLDANSAFGSDFDAVFYPKVSGSVVLSDLEFWGDAVGPFSTFRLRGAVGQSGLQPGAFDAVTTYGSIVSDVAGVVPNNVGNENLKPEITTEWEAGTEVGAFQDRLTLEATYWNRTTADALVQRQFSPAGGFRNAQLVNIGTLKGQGVDLSVESNVLDREDLSVDLFANAAYLWEQVEDLGGAPPIKAGGSYPRPRNYVVEGYAPGAHFGAALQEVPEGRLPVDLIDESGGSVQPGQDGNPDSRAALVQYLDGRDLSELMTDGGLADFPISTDEVLLKGPATDAIGGNLDHYKGKPFPDWNGSFGFDATVFGNFSISTLFEYKAGNFAVNNLSGAFAGRSPGLGRNTETVARAGRNFVTGGVDEDFQPQGDGEVRTQALETWIFEELGLAPFSGLNYIEDADFIRWRELSVTYDLPSGWVSQLGARSSSITFAGRNLKLWTPTGYSGIDPESNEVSAGSGGSVDQNFRKGIEAWQVPVQRRFTLKLQISF